MRLVSGGFCPFIVHSICGVGAPDIGMLMLIGSPALTLMRPPIRPSKCNLGFSLVSFAVYTSDISLGLPEPAALIALTRYSYCLPSCTWVSSYSDV